MKIIYPHTALKHALRALLLLLATATALAQPEGSTPLGTMSDFCTQVTVTASQPTFSNGCCYIDVTYKHDWTATPNTSALMLPLGIEIEFVSNTVISSHSRPNPPGTWIVKPSPVLTTTLAASYKSVKFQRSAIPNSNGSWAPFNPANNNAIIPSGQTQTVRLCVSHTGAGPIVVRVHTLNGYPPGTTNNDRACIGDQITLEPPPATYTASSSSICAGAPAVVTLTPAPPAGSTITWYSHTPVSGSPNCPTTDPPLAPWSVATTNGNAVYNTNPLQQTRCYIAEIKTGCFTYYSTVARVSVCPPLGGIALQSTPAIQQHPWDAALHVCNSYSGTISVAGLDPALCNATFQWWVNGTPQGSTGSTLQVSNLGVVQQACNTTHAIRVRVTTACGTVERTMTIVVDRSGVTPTLSSTPASPALLCQKQGAVLTANPLCGRIIRWEESANGGSTWTTIAAAGTSATYWTNPLLPPGSTRRYRVWAQNFACAPVASAPVQLTVKPDLTVSIAANKICLLPPAPTITATIPNGYTPATYQWFRNGTQIPPTTQTITAAQEGFYQVRVYDAACDVEAWSNIVSICKVAVEIAGRACVCPGDAVELKAVPIGECASGCSYTWTSTSGFTGSGPQIGDGSPNWGSSSTITYTVTMNCGSGCSVSNTFTVTRCPQ